MLFSLSHTNDYALICIFNLSYTIDCHYFLASIHQNYLIKVRKLYFIVANGNLISNLCWAVYVTWHRRKEPLAYYIILQCWIWSIWQRMLQSFITSVSSERMCNVNWWMMSYFSAHAGCRAADIKDVLLLLHTLFSAHAVSAHAVICTRC